MTVSGPVDGKGGGANGFGLPRFFAAGAGFICWSPWPPR